MPRRPSRRAASEHPFPGGDGASGSTPRLPDIPQLLPSSDAVAMATARRLNGTGSSASPAISVRRGLGGMQEEEEEEEEEEEGGSSLVEEEQEQEQSFEEGEGPEGDGEGDMEDVDEEMAEDDSRFSSVPIPANLREISSLASWTVSTHKPGCGVSALRNPSPSLFWQSDGPQPHTLTLHFFKRVSIVRMRVYLDFELDESYTPTKMIFLAGMGGNDLVEFATWQGESPCGWVDINLEGVGGSYTRSHPQRRKKKDQKKSNDDEYEDEDRENNNPNDDEDGDVYEDDIDLDDPSAGNVLKAMVVQARICENHQNGKDTHVRGFQVFARDDKYFSRTRRNSTRGQHTLKMPDGRESFGQDVGNEVALAKFDEEDWLQEPELR